MKIFFVTNSCPVIQEGNPPLCSPALTTITLKVHQTQTEWMPLITIILNHFKRYRVKPTKGLTFVYPLYFTQ